MARVVVEEWSPSCLPELPDHLYAYRLDPASRSETKGGYALYQISVAGHFCVDLSPRLPANATFTPGQLFEVGPLDIRLGGCVANTGLCLYSLGAAVDLQATVGDDRLGNMASELLIQASGGASEPVVTLGAGTSYSLVLEPPGIDRTFWHYTGTNSIFQAESVRIGADLLHLGYPSLLPSLLDDDAAPLVALLERLRETDATTSLDFAVVDPESAVGVLDWSHLLDRILGVVDVVSPSVDDCCSMLRVDSQPSLGLADDMCSKLLENGAAVAMVTAGEYGVVLRVAGEARLRGGGKVLREISAEWAGAHVIREAPKLDQHLTSSGAGDAASAGLLYGLAAGIAPAETVDLALATSACIMQGLRPSRKAFQTVAPDLVDLLK